MSSHSELQHSHNNIHPVNYTITSAQRRTCDCTHAQTIKDTDTVHAVTVRERRQRVCLRLFSHQFTSLSASYCSHRHSPAEPPSAPLVCTLSSPFLTNLSLIYLLLSSAGGCCQQQTAVGPLEPDRAKGQITKGKWHVAQQRKQGKLFFVIREVWRIRTSPFELVFSFFAASHSGM